MISISQMLDALAASTDGQEPFLIHARTVRTLLSDKQSDTTELGALLTRESRNKYVAIYAADCYGAVDDFVVMGKSLPIPVVAKVLDELRHTPDSALSEDQDPPYVREWMEAYNGED